MKGVEGRKVKDRITERLKMKWYYSHSPGYIKYLGYPIWFSNHQRDIYVSKLLRKVNSAVEIFSNRQVSLYGKANIVNTMILSRLWHVIRIVPLLDVLKQLKSIIYQFVMSGLFPKLKGNSFFLPRDQGGLDLIDIGSQQYAFLQFRYLRVLLQGNSGLIPEFTYRLLLVNALRLSQNTPDHAMPLFFKSARYKNTLNGFHPFHSMFNAMDICRQQSSLNIDWHQKPSMMTIMSLPLVKIFNFDEIVNGLEFLQHESAKTGKVQDFFEYNYDQNQSQLIPKTTCQKRNIWIKINRALLPQDITYKTFIHNKNTEEDFDLQPFNNTLIFQQLILHLSNKEIRFIMQSMNNIDVGSHFNKNVTKKQWTVYYKNNMHYSARNVWYRMLHNQTSKKLALYQRELSHIESDRCDLCNNEVEDAKRLLISCAHKIDVWNFTFNEFLGYPKSADPHLVYNSIMLDPQT